MSTMALAAIGSKRRSRKDVRDGACAIPKSIHVLFFIYVWRLRASELWCLRVLELESFEACGLLSFRASVKESFRA